MRGSFFPSCIVRKTRVGEQLDAENTLRGGEDVVGGVSKISKNFKAETGNSTMRSTRWRTRLSDRRRRRSISGNLELGWNRLRSPSLGEREKERVSRKRSRDGARWVCYAVYPRYKREREGEGKYTARLCMVNFFMPEIFPNFRHPW